MLIPPKYSLTPTISQFLSGIEASREIIDTITIPPDVATNIRRESYLKSSLFSARIEGNSLTLTDLHNRSSKDQKKVEIFNILKALQFILQKRGKDITIKDIIELHTIVMDNLGSDVGKLRSEVNAIFNSAGIAIYMPPPPRQVLPLIEKLLKFINSGKELFVPIRACLAHYCFEKIHPFIDGNGRVGRLLFQTVLHKAGYGMKGLVSVEEYLDNHRLRYYRGFESSEKDVTDYIEFMLEAIAQASEKAKQLVLHKRHAEAEDYLLPRRAEIFRVIKEQRLVNFDQIRRRFLAVNQRTLRYDLKKLVDAGLIKKLGTTKGVYYQQKDS